jgi:hypothetical protein
VRQNALISHVVGRMLRANEYITTRDLVCAVFSCRQDPAIRLAVHGLWSQGCSRKENCATMKSESALDLWELQEFHFDEGVLLGFDTFAGGPVMIGATLIVHCGENGIALAKLNLIE